MSSSKIGKEKFRKIVEEALESPPIRGTKPTKQEEQPRDWKDLQVKVGKIYESLGCEVKQDVQVKGARTKHKIDVLAVFEFGGQKYQIALECKFWNSKVKKAQVSSFLGVLADVGAEKGIIVSKIGFQSGAHKLASYTNIELVTFDELKKSSMTFIERIKMYNGLERIRSLGIPFARFRSKMWEETKKKDLWWYPSDRGYKFSGALSLLRSRIDDLDLLTFPRGYIYVFISDREEEVWKEANSRGEYLDYILDNLKILEKEYEKFRKEIFSE